MKRTELTKAQPLRQGLAVTVALFFAATATQVVAQQVKAPPLPPGSALIKVQGGMNPDEIQREARAHHHKGHVKKDLNKDDSLPGTNGNGNGGKKS